MASARSGPEFRQISESAPQTQGIELIDGKNSDAALRATRPADKPFAAAAGCLFERRVNDLDQLLIVSQNLLEIGC